LGIDQTPLFYGQGIGVLVFYEQVPQAERFVG
jgi:hypothetical protein